jgi:hypothetical protein
MGRANSCFTFWVSFPPPRDAKCDFVGQEEAGIGTSASTTGCSMSIRTLIAKAASVTFNILVTNQVTNYSSS